MRPPGHHAKHDHYAGFSFFNNVALAAQKAASQGKRVLIFDWDVHHGDGTQTMFYDSDQVLFMSLHRFDDGTFYPRNGIGAPSYTGEGKGAFHNVNCAWNTGLVVNEDDREDNQVSELGCNEYKYACDEVLFPIAQRFDPDIILISAGFDAAIHDPLGWSKLCPLMFYHMTRELMKICPKVLAVLEGGYNPDYLGQHASGVVKALLGVPEESYGEPTQADRDAGFTRLSQIRGEDAV